MGSAGYTRVTLAGTGRRVDVVVPSGEPVGRLLPEALRLVGEPPGQAPASRGLARLDGSLLHPQSTLGEAGVADGSILRVVGVAEAPPPPVVLDVTEEVADGLEPQVWRWGPGPRRWAATALAVAAVLFAGHLAAAGFGSFGAAALLVGGAAVLMVVGAAVSAPAPGPGVAVCLAGTGLGLYAAWSLSSSTGFAVRAGLAVLAFAVALLGASRVLGRGGVVGGLTGLGLLNVWTVTVTVLGPARAGALLAVASVLALGLLPRYALALSGLTGLDDRRVRDEPVTLREVGDALTVAHRGLSLTAVAVAISAAAAGWLLAADAGQWTLPLAVLLGVVLVVRVRAFPLVLPVVAVLASAAVVGAALALAWLRAGPQQWPVVVALVAGVGVAAAGATTWRMPEHARARARRLADRVETAAVLAMVPVLAGVFGVYGRLLQAV